MDYRDLAIDRIHYLVERAAELYNKDLCEDAELLMEQAMDIAEELRNTPQVTFA